MAQSILNNDIAPDLADRDRNTTVDIYVVDSALGIDHTDTTNTKCRAGSVFPGSFDVIPEITTNKTMLGGQKTKRTTHINALALNMVGEFNEITPFGNQLGRLADTPTNYSLTADLYTITAVALQSLTLATVANLAVGDYLQVIGEGAALPEMHAYVKSITGLMITLEQPLDGVPDVAYPGRVVTRWEGALTGGRIKEYTAFARVSGDDDAVLYHEILKGEFTEGKESFPDADIAKNRLSFESTATKLTRLDGRTVPKLLSEFVYPSGF